MAESKQNAELLATLNQDLTHAVEQAVVFMPQLSGRPESQIGLLLDSGRLSQLIQLVLEATQESPQALASDMPLLLRASSRVRNLADRLRTLALVGPLTTPDFDDEIFGNKVMSQSPERIRQLLELAIADENTLTGPKSALRILTLAELGVPIIALNGTTVILFKLIVILIVLLIGISFPALVPFLLAVLFTLRSLDQKAGGAHGPQTGGGGGGTTPPTTRSRPGEFSGPTTEPPHSTINKKASYVRHNDTGAQIHDLHITVALPDGTLVPSPVDKIDIWVVDDQGKKTENVGNGTRPPGPPGKGNSFDIVLKRPLKVCETVQIDVDFGIDIDPNMTVSIVATSDTGGPIVPH